MDVSAVSLILLHAHFSIKFLFNHLEFFWTVFFLLFPYSYIWRMFWYDFYRFGTLLSDAALEKPFRP